MQVAPSPDGTPTPALRSADATARPRKASIGLGMRLLAAVIALALTVVIVAPIALSSQDLVRWSADPAGLGLSPGWAWLAFVALDAAAAVCVGMVTFAAWRGEAGGAFHILTWMFALGSATANYRHGLSTAAKDDEYFFPAMSLTGPLLLDVTLARIRRWVRLEARTQLAPRPKFGPRWLPGVAFRETLAAWRTSIREGISRPDEAVAHVREVRALAGLSPADALHLAYQALGHTDPYTARTWLLARGVNIDQATLTAVTAAMAPAATAELRPEDSHPGGSHGSAAMDATATVDVTTAAIGGGNVTPAMAGAIGARPATATSAATATGGSGRAATAMSATTAGPRVAASATGTAIATPAGTASGVAATARSGRVATAPGASERAVAVAGAKAATAAATRSSTARTVIDVTDEAMATRRGNPARATGREPHGPSTAKDSTSGTAAENRMADAIALLNGNMGMTAPEMAAQLRALGWTLSDRTAARVLTDARTQFKSSRLAAVR